MNIYTLIKELIDYLTYETASIDRDWKSSANLLKNEIMKRKWKKQNVWRAVQLLKVTGQKMHLQAHKDALEGASDCKRHFLPIISEQSRR